MEWSQILWVSALLVAAVFVPGFALTLAAFPRINQIPWAERIGLSFVFGFIPSLILYFMTKNMNVPIDTFTAPAIIAVVTFAGVGVWMLRKNKD